jgi:branched-chain amino acid transport system ATP-binding protein
MSEVLLKVQGLDVYYGAVHALKGVDLEVRRGEVVTLIGANGAGKTTTLRAISGLVKPSAGTVRFDGAEITTTAAHAIVARGLIHAPEGRGIFANMTVAENLEIGAFLRKDTAQIKKDKDHALSLFPRLKERLAQNAGTLSGGEQQMLAIARGMLSKPRLLMLDEPSMGVAPIFKDFIFDALREIRDREQLTLLIVEQDADIALGIADYGYVIETGRVVTQGYTAALADNEEVRRAYLGG